MAKGPSRFAHLALMLLVLLGYLSTLAIAQACYYPNGQIDQTQAPCSSVEGSACCPQKWQCLDNGLCYYPPDNLYGRYGCTDKSWKSPYCPSQLGTKDLTASGGEAITQCPNHNNQWCCDGNRDPPHCCDTGAKGFFDLPEGKAYATVGSGSPPASAPTVSQYSGNAMSTQGSGSPPKSSDTPASQPSSKPTTASSKPGSSAAPSSTRDSGSSAQGSAAAASTSMVTSVQTSIASGVNGLSTVLTTITTGVAAPAAATKDPEPKSSKSKTPLIVGCAVGIPLGLAVIGLLILLLRRRRNSTTTPNKDPAADSPFGASKEFVGGAAAKPGASVYRHDSNVAELPPQSVGPGRPISTIKGMAELESGAGFVPGTTPHAPHLVGVGGGTSGTAGHTPQSSWGSAPPGYSPGMNNAANGAGGWGRDSHELDAQSTVPAAQQQGATAVTPGQRYIPYRQPGQATENHPDVAELPATKTP